MDLNKTLTEAKEQLKRYTAILWNKEKYRVNYLAIASDGITFYVFRPRTSKETDIEEEDITLDEINRISFKFYKPEDIFFWLDRYFLSKELLIPKTEQFSREFGSRSSLFKDVKSDLEDAISIVSDNSSFKTIFDEWSKYLAVVYGSSVENRDLFIKHTYLSILSKLMVYSFYSRGDIPTEEIVEKILIGGIFEEWGIKNFIVEDFFVWIIRDPIKQRGIKISKKILEKLSRYDLSKLDEDVLKGLYQELVDPEERHDLGEYYTPDWLAEYILRELLKRKPMKSILDPACGSGTFLFTSIKLKKEFLKKMNSKNLLYHILNRVVGIDIHPLAIIIAKTNYLLALGDLLQGDREEIPLPIYMADSIRLIEEEKETFFKIKNYKIHTIDNKEFFLLPADFLDKYLLDTEKIDQLIDLIRDEASKLAENDSFEKRVVIDFLKENTKIPEKDMKKYSDSLFKTIETFSELIKKNKDTIWGFIFKNKYKPLYLLKRKFDLIVGNPPWLVFNSVKNVDYQNFLKDQITDVYNLTKKAELITHMELATLFFVRCSEFYLKNEGTISFVMPRSVFVSDHHSSFRNCTFVKPKIKLYKILDLENVKPLFNVPSCAIFGLKGKKTTFPILTEVINGKLEKKNENYETALKKLEIKKSKLYLSRLGDRDSFSEKPFMITAIKKSFYYDKFSQGATIVPRQFWFIKIKKHPTFGFSPKTPYIVTSERAIRLAKKPYQNVKLEGNIESEFIFGALTGSELVPFGYLELLPVVIPVKIKQKKFVMFDRDKAKKENKKYLYEWLQNCERIWKEKRGEKIKESALMWLDYRKKLTNQSPSVKFKVLYNTSGTYLTSCVIDVRQKLFVKVDSSDLILDNFVSDYTTYYCEIDNENEVFYVVSFLNSKIIDDIIKPMQAKGQFGERHIVKKPLEIPMPKFDPKNKAHIELSKLGKLCTSKVKKILPGLSKKYTSIGKIRSEIREQLKQEIEKIDELVKKILSESSKKSYGLKKYIQSK